MTREEPQAGHLSPFENLQSQLKHFFIIKPYWCSGHELHMRSREASDLQSDGLNYFHYLSELS